MFDSLSDRLGATLDGLKGKGRLSEDDINTAMREIRLALLEADVNFGVVKDFVARVRERAMGAEVMDSLTPGQQVVKIVHEELTDLMGEAGTKLSFSNRPPTVILMAGPAGLRQDHRLRQARPPAGQAEALARAGRLRRLPARGHPAAADARQVAAGAGLRPRHGATRSRSPPGASSRPRRRAVTS